MSSPTPATRSRTGASSTRAESRSLSRSGQEPRGRAPRARLCARSGADRSRGERAPGGRSAVPAAPRRFDFDMMIGTWTASPSPGNEQRGRWSSAAANAEGAYNISGAEFAGDRRDDRGDSGRARARGFRRGGARARPPADLRLLHRARSSTRPSNGSPIRASSAGRKGRRCSASTSRPGGGASRNSVCRPLRALSGGASLEGGWSETGARHDGFRRSPGHRRRQRRGLSVVLSRRKAPRRRTRAGAAAGRRALAPLPARSDDPRGRARPRAYMEKKFGKDGRLKPRP